RYRSMRPAPVLPSPWLKVMGRSNMYSCPGVGWGTSTSSRRQRSIRKLCEVDSSEAVTPCQRVMKPSTSDTRFPFPLALCGPPKDSAGVGQPARHREALRCEACCPEVKEEAAAPARAGDGAGGHAGQQASHRGAPANARPAVPAAPLVR